MKRIVEGIDEITIGGLIAAIAGGAIAITAYALQAPPVTFEDAMKSANRKMTITFNCVDTAAVREYLSIAKSMINNDKQREKYDYQYARYMQKVETCNCKNK